MPKIPDESGTVAHYTKLEHLANILADKRLLMSPVKNLLDPRENSMDWIEKADGHNSISSIKLKQIKLQASEHIRLLCTAGEREKIDGSSLVEEAPYGRPRMWAQYGDSCRGFCIVLDAEKLDAELVKIAVKSECKLSGRVDYYPWLHTVASSIDISPDSIIENELDNSFSILNDNNMLHSIYFKKSNDWLAESEHRFLLYTQAREPIYLPIDNALKYVVLGTNFPMNQIPQAQFYCAELKCKLYSLEYIHPQYLIHER